MGIVGIMGLFVMKVVDNVLATNKTILIQKNKGILASINVILSSIIFYKLISAVNNANSDLAMYFISIGSGVGTYIAIKINDKVSKEKVYVNVIMSDDKDAMIDLRDYLKENKITNLVTDGYTKDWEKTIAITAYSQTKEESKKLDKYIKYSNAKFKRVVTRG